MTKSELISRIAAVYPYMHLKNVERVVNIVLKAIETRLAQGGRVELRDFGSFSVRTRAPIVGRNPKTGEAVQIPERKIPFFKAGKRLRHLVDKGYEEAND